MANKKQYYALDDIGFIGTQSRSKAQIKKDAERTTQHIKAKKSEKTLAASKQQILKSK